MLPTGTEDLGISCPPGPIQMTSLLDDMEQWTLEDARAEVMAIFMPGMADLAGMAEEFAAVSEKVHLQARSAAVVDKDLV